MRAIKTTTISILAVGLLAGSTVGVAAESAVVTGSMASGDDCEMTPEGAEFCTGGRAEYSDPRLTGDLEQTLTEVFAEGGKGFDMAFIATEDFRLTNDGGSWTGQCPYADFFPSEVPEGYEVAELPEEYQHVESGPHCFLTGEDGYEGLSAYLTSGPTGSWGVILEAEPME